MKKIFIILFLCAFIFSCTKPISCEITASVNVEVTKVDSGVVYHFCWYDMRFNPPHKLWTIGNEYTTICPDTICYLNGNYYNSVFDSQYAVLHSCYTVPAKTTYYYDTIITYSFIDIMTQEEINAKMCSEITNYDDIFLKIPNSTNYAK